MVADFGPFDLRRILVPPTLERAQFMTLAVEIYEGGVLVHFVAEALAEEDDDTAVPAKLISIEDDVETLYRPTGGGAGSGRRAIGGRIVERGYVLFEPSPPDEATTLIVRSPGPAATFPL
jgi:hypothetical protein